MGVTLRGDWDWWRHNHGYPLGQAMRLTLASWIWLPVKNIYGWVKIQTYWRWKERERDKLQEAIKAGDMGHWRVRRFIKKAGRF